MALAIALAASSAVHAGAPRTYILSGYDLSGLKGVDTAALEERLSPRPGAPITQAQIDADNAIVTADLKARGAQGRLVTTLAEKHGHVWVIFDLLGTAQPILGVVNGVAARLAVQRFEGATRLSPQTLQAASGLSIGQALTPSSLIAARAAILRAYAKGRSGGAIGLTAKVQRKPDGQVILTWMVRDSGAVGK